MLSGKCASCSLTIYSKVNQNIIVNDPSTLNAWRFAHQAKKLRNPADCTKLSLPIACQEYEKCRLECVNCHDQNTSASYVRGTGNAKKLTYHMASHRSITDILESEKYKKFIQELDDRNVRSTAKEPAISFKELDVLLRRNFHLSLHKVVDWDEVHWITPRPNNRAVIEIVLSLNWNTVC